MGAESHCKSRKRRNLQSLSPFFMQAVGGAGRLSEDGCASAYKESLNCELPLTLSERERMNRRREAEIALIN